MVNHKRKLKKRIKNKMKQQESFLLNSLLSLSIQFVLLTFDILLWIGVFVLRCIRYYIPEFTKEQWTLYQYRKHKSRISKNYHYGNYKKP